MGARVHRGELLAAGLLLASACAPTDEGVDVVEAAARVSPALAGAGGSHSLLMKLVGGRHTAVDVFYTVRDADGAALTSGSVGGLRLDAGTAATLDEPLLILASGGTFTVDLSVRREGRAVLERPGAAALRVLPAGSDERMTAVVNGVPHGIARFNDDRGPQELVLFVPIAGWERTHTNEFGCELTVEGGVVTGKAYPFLDGGAGGGVPIPDGGFVLSGHAGTGDWLCLPGDGHANAQLGDPVSLLGVPWP